MYNVLLFSFFLLLIAQLRYAKNQPNVGLVEVSGPKGWSEVCHHRWNDIDAGVVCRELGYVSGKAITNATRGSIGMSLGFSDAFYKFNCSGKESRLLNCSFSDYYWQSCVDGSLAGAVCYETSLSNIDMSKFCPKKKQNCVKDICK